jgi:predicted nucleotidyltransferase
MANFHSDEWIMARLTEHYEEAKKHFDESRIVGIFIQGSQNYGLNYEGSDIDTKLIVVPTFKEIALNKKPHSTTHIRANEEHIDFKDIRLYIQCFEKQNLNFLEILFTPYKIINPLYAEFWQKLIDAREQIARMNPLRAVKSMKGMALEKYHAMKHEYPTKIEIIKKYGYDPKQLHHLIRIDNFLTRYLNGEAYESCLQPNEKLSDFLLDIKHGKYDLKTAEYLAEISLEHIEKITNGFCAGTSDKEDLKTKALLYEVSYDVMKTAVKTEIF